MSEMRAEPMNLHCSCSCTGIFSTSSRPHLMHLNTLAETEKRSQKYRVKSQHHWSQQQTSLFPRRSSQHPCGSGKVYPSAISSSSKNGITVWTMVLQVYNQPPEGQDGSFNGEEHSPRTEEIITELEQTAASSTSVIGGNIFTFPSAFIPLDDPGKTKPLIQKSKQHSQLYLIIQIGTEPELLCYWWLKSFYEPGRDLATFASLKVFQSFLQSRNTIPPYFHLAQTKLKTSIRQTSGKTSSFAI